MRRGKDNENEREKQDEDGGEKSEENGINSEVTKNKGR